MRRSFERKAASRLPEEEGAQAFFLAHGGYVDGFTEFGEPFTRPATGKLPEGLILPRIPVTPGRP